MMSSIYQLILHPILALTGDVKVSAKMMGVGGLVRRILRVILDTIWISTAPKEFECAIAHRRVTAPTMWKCISGKIR